MRLDSLFARYNVQRDFDILVVDVEGSESVAFDSFDLAKRRPKMMLVELEDTHESFQEYEGHVTEHKILRNSIVSRGYIEIYSDEINTIFVRHDQQR